MSKTVKLFSIFAALTLLALAFATPARAFDSRTGDTVIIAKDEVIEDDLYISATTIVLDGTVKGDLIAFGQTITVNGVVEGDLLSAGQAIIITGEIMDDARIAGQVLQVGSSAVIGDDLIAAGMSLEMQKGSQVGGDLVVGSGQVLVAGDVADDIEAGTAAFELRGSVGGNVQAFVDATSDTHDGPPMNMLMTQSPVAIPSVPAGLTIADSAKIGGNLEYSSTIELPIPSGVVGGKVTRTEPAVDAKPISVEPSSAQKVNIWIFGLFHRAVSLILIGLLFSWLFPNFLANTTKKLQTQFWPSLGWGFIGGMAYLFTGLILFVATIFLFVIGLAFTLGGLAVSVLFTGLLALSVMTLLFILAIVYLVFIIVGSLLGKWILGMINPSLAEHKVWPMVLGIFILVVVVDVLHFPLVPLGFFGNLLNFIIALFGLGAVWLWGRERFAKKASVQ